MGNHEFCEQCGESTFHRGRPCDPEKVRKRQAERQAYEERANAAKRRAATFAMGHPRAYQDDHGNVVIPLSAFMEG